jgi:Tol biopolymer transport system component
LSLQRHLATPTVMTTSTFPRTPRARALLAALPLWLGIASCEDPPVEWSMESVPEPAVFGAGVISSPDRDYGIAFTPDGSEAYFTRRSRRGPPQIYVTTFGDGRWTEPEVAPFATDRDEAPFITPDGSTMLFSSRRVAPGTWDRSENIWSMTRLAAGAWSEPELLPGEVNQPRNEIEEFTTGTELGPILLSDGSLMYWTRVDPDWGSDLYVAERDAEGTYVDPRPLRVNSYGDESNPAMSPDGRYLVFQGYGSSDALGEQDLYISERTEYGWGEPRLLPEPFNSTRSDGWPSFSPNGRHFFFASDRDRRGGYYDIYYVDVAALHAWARQ